jgi:predicted DNA-binding transcriptional regulator AlpA
MASVQKSSEPGLEPAELLLSLADHEGSGQCANRPLAAPESGTRMTVLDCLHRIADSLSRVSDHFDPPPPDIVGTPYVAAKLGCTTDWIAMMVRDRQIPASCLIPGTGEGKPWKFRRSRIDEWIERRKRSTIRILTKGLT